MRYLLDTNMFVAVMARSDTKVMARMAEHRESMGLSAIVAHELYFGAFNSAKVNHNLAEIAGLGLPLLDFDEDDARAAGEVRAMLKQAGTPIGPFDTLIAGQALARGLILVTANTREFARVTGLPVEDWT